MRVKDICERAKTASYSIMQYSTCQKNKMLEAIANALESSKERLFEANKVDIELCKDKDTTFIDRLTLTDSRIDSMVEGIRQIIKLDDPVGEVVEEWTLDNGLNLKKVRSPLGVIAIIYEARPNVTVDAAALALKSGNAVVLRGSKDAINSNRELYLIMVQALESAGFEKSLVGFIDDESREAQVELLKQDEFIDVVIPRGGEGLKQFVLTHATMPVIASAGGNCHIYVEKSADFEMAEKIVVNAKVSRPSVCNALEHLLVDESIAKEFLPSCVEALRKNGVELVGCARTLEIIPDIMPLSAEDDSTEYLSYKMSIRIVDNVAMATEHINRFGTKHSEAIVTSDDEKANYFTTNVDAAAVYVNVSTRFTDGFEFGLGAEMGISTQKLHVRGPVALKELTSVKYQIYGSGQIRI